MPSNGIIISNTIRKNIASWRLLHRLKMKLYGIEKVLLASCEEETCPVCKRDKLTISSWSGYLHLFGYPLFPISRQVFATCNYCRRIFSLSDLKDELRAKALGLKERSRLPLRQFGVVPLLFLVLVTIAGYGLYQERIKFIRAKNPKPGDTYVVETESGNYSLYRLVDLKEDTLYMQLNSFEINNPDNIDQIDKKENFTGKVVAFKKQDILELLEKGAIQDVNRNE